MPDSKRFLHPEAIKRITRLELRARHIVEGSSPACTAVPYFGQSIEFRQHREYTFGDDPRHIDWKVWAKQDRYYVKQFEEDTNLRCTLLVDVSGSMRYGRGPAEQVRLRLHHRRLPGLSAVAAAGLGGLLVLRRKSADGRARCDRGGTTWSRSCRPSTSSVPRDKTDLYPILREVAETYPRRGMMVLISDLLADRDGLFRGPASCCAAAGTT